MLEKEGKLTHSDEIARRIAVKHLKIRLLGRWQKGFETEKLLKRMNAEQASRPLVRRIVKH